MLANWMPEVINRERQRQEERERERESMTTGTKTACRKQSESLMKRSDRPQRQGEVRKGKSWNIETKNRQRGCGRGRSLLASIILPKLNIL